MADAEHAAWLADKIGALGDYAKEAAAMLRRWPAPAPSQAQSEPDMAAMFRAEHEFLEWNRQQTKPLVSVAYEYGVFRKAVELYLAAAGIQSPAAPVMEGGEMQDAGECHSDLLLLAAYDLESWMKSYNRDTGTEDLVKRLRGAALGVPGAPAPEFKLVGQADFHMSAEMDVVIGTDLFIRNPAAPVGGEAWSEGTESLRAFALAVLEDWPDLAPDAFDLQDLAVKHGLLALRNPRPTEPCGENCGCVEYFGADEWAEGVDCYIRTPLLLGASSVLEAQPQPSEGEGKTK